MATILGFLGGGSLLGVVIGGVEVYLKARKAKQILSLVHDLAALGRKNYESLKGEERKRADETMATYEKMRGGAI